MLVCRRSTSCRALSQQCARRWKTYVGPHGRRMDWAMIVCGRIHSNKRNKEHTHARTRVDGSISRSVRQLVSESDSQTVRQPAHRRFVSKSNTMAPQPMPNQRVLRPADGRLDPCRRQRSRDRSEGTPEIWVGGEDGEGVGRGEG